MNELTNPWLVASYQATSMFSLKPASSTSSGGKTLLCPTPFALKMALLDAALRYYGEAKGKLLFEPIKKLRIAFKPPEHAVVNNTFTKILRPHKAGPKDAKGTGLMTPMGNTIAFREYVCFKGDLSFAFQGMALEELRPLLIRVNYLGKRGGFVQIQSPPQAISGTNEEMKFSNYTVLTESTAEFSINGLLQMLDDCGPKMTFEQVNVYNSGKGSTIRLGSGPKDRILHHIVLPYRLVRSSKGYRYYERIDE